MTGTRPGAPSTIEELAGKGEEKPGAEGRGFRTESAFNSALVGNITHTGTLLMNGN